MDETNRRPDERGDLIRRLDHYMELIGSASSNMCNRVLYNMKVTPFTELMSCTKLNSEPELEAIQSVMLDLLDNGVPLASTVLRYSEYFSLDPNVALIKYNLDNPIGAEYLLCWVRDAPTVDVLGFLADLHSLDLTGNG